MNKLYSLLLASACALGASAQGVMVTKNQIPTFLKDIPGFTFGNGSIIVDGTTFEADEVIPFPAETLIPGETARIDFLSKASSRTLRIVSPYVWMAASVPAGFTLDQTYGTAGCQEITISVVDNPTATSFTGTLVLMGGTGTLCTIELSQMGAQDPQNPYVYMPDSNFERFVLANFDKNHDGLLAKADEALAIKSLNVSDLELTSVLGVEQMKNLEEFDCSYNNIEGTLSFAGLAHLKTLHAEHNLMTTLDVSGCSALEELWAHDCYPSSDYQKPNRPFRNINLKGCSALSFLHLEDNHLEALDLSDCASLDFLKATDNCFPSLDVTRCPKLRILQCRKNDNLTGQLDLTGCPALEELWASETKLDGVNASKNPALNYIDVHATNLTRLDVKGCAALRKLYAHNTGIRTLDLSASTNLELLWVKFDNMQELDLTHCPNLVELQAGSNALQTLDLSKCTALRTLELNNNQLLSLNLKGCAALETVQANHNLLTNLDLSNCTALKQIDVLGNRLTTLDVNACPALTTLQVSENELASIACDKCPELYYFYAEDNQLTTIDLTKNTQLTEVALGKNRLQTALIKGLSNVGELELFDNQLTEIDLTGLVSVQELYIQNNPTLAKLDTRPLQSMRQLDCRNTGIGSYIDLSPNPAMAFLFATECPNLKTVYILEGADYSALSVDEGVEIIEKQPDQVVPDTDDDTHWSYGEGCTDFVPMMSMADFDKNAAYLIASPDGKGNAVVASNVVENNYYAKGVSYATAADGSISKTADDKIMDYIWRLIPKVGDDGQTHYMLYHEYINNGNYAVSQQGSGDFTNPYSHDGSEGRIWFDTQAEVDALSNGSQYWDLSFDASGNAVLTSCYNGRKGVTMGYCPDHNWLCIGYSDAPHRAIRLYKLAAKGEETLPDEPQQNPRIGDFYYSDGTWSTTLNKAKKPIGIVFRVGCATEYGDNISYYRLKDGKTRFEEIKGYVVALQDASESGCWWSSFNDDKGCGCSTSTEDFRGYSNTKSIIATADAKGGLTSNNSSFPACYYATTAYEAACPAPAKTSGWYLPSAFQMAYIWNRVWFDEDNSGRACLENSFKQLGDAATPLYRNDAEYWTSTEQVNSYGNSNYAYYFDFSANNIYNGTISHYRKNTNMLVRSILTF